MTFTISGCSTGNVIESNALSGMKMTPEQKEDLMDLVAFVKGETFLELSVMDIDFEGDTLLVLTNPDVPRSFVEMMLKRQWEGPIEVYCATDFITGSAVA